MEYLIDIQMIAKLPPIGGLLCLFLATLFYFLVQNMLIELMFLRSLKSDRRFRFGAQRCLRNLPRPRLHLLWPCSDVLGAS